MPLEGALSARPRSAEDGGQAFSSSSPFCIYVRFRLQLPSAGVQAMSWINVLVSTSKSHVSGMCNITWLPRASGSATKESRVTMGVVVHRPSGWHRAFGSHSTFGCVATISRCATIIGMAH